MITAAEEAMLSPSQLRVRDAFDKFLFDPDEHEFIVSGKSGSGKSFLIRYLADIAEGTGKLMHTLTGERASKIHLTATTHKAAYVLSEKMQGEYQTRTIHNLLGLVVKNDYSTGKSRAVRSERSQIVKDRIVFVDEASMINRDLLDSIRDNTMNCKLVFIGDAYQLNPVREGMSPVFTEDPSKVHHLTEIHRQAKGNTIVDLGEKFRGTIDGEGWPEIAEDGKNIFKLTGEEFENLVRNKFSVATDPDSVKVIAWSNNQVQAYNRYIRGMFTPSEAFIVGEIVITNKPIHYNGSVEAPTDSRHIITDIEESYQHDMDGYKVELDNWIVGFLPKDPNLVAARMKHHAKLKEWHEYFFYKDMVLDLRSAYSLTAHKSQGSTYEDVFIDLSDIGRNTNWRETARLLYVAITRASHRVYFYGDLPRRYLPI